MDTALNSLAGTAAPDAMAAAIVTLSARAARRITHILKAEPAGSVVRLAVSGGGCSGFKYEYSVTAERADDDTAVARDGATVLIDAVSLEFLHGSEIDFVDDLIGQSFQIRNPNATASCGCGTSFSI